MVLMTLDIAIGVVFLDFTKTFYFVNHENDGEK